MIYLQYHWVQQILFLKQCKGMMLLLGKQSVTEFLTYWAVYILQLNTQETEIYLSIHIMIHQPEVKGLLRNFYKLVPWKVFLYGTITQILAAEQSWMAS